MADRVVVRNETDRGRDVIRDREPDNRSWILSLLLTLLTLFILWWLFFPRTRVDTAPERQNTLELDVNENVTTPTTNDTTPGNEPATPPSDQMQQ